MNMIKRISTVFCLCLCLSSCLFVVGQSTEGQTAFGSKVSKTEVMDVRNLVYQLKNTNAIEGATVSGKIVDVCKKKGCWMKLENPQGDAIHVMFKNYALFMPQDIIGKSVVMHGKAFVSTTSIDELRHYAEDAGKSKAEIRKINTPKKELRFEADGVEIITD